jgi:hypothetical protein
VAAAAAAAAAEAEEAAEATAAKVYLFGLDPRHAGGLALLACLAAAAYTIDWKP